MVNIVQLCNCALFNGGGSQQTGTIALCTQWTSFRWNCVESHVTNRTANKPARCHQCKYTICIDFQYCYQKKIVCFTLKFQIIIGTSVLRVAVACMNVWSFSCHDAFNSLQWSNPRWLLRIWRCVGVCTLRHRDWTISLQWRWVLK